MYKVIATGSKGNAVIYQDNILVDVGIPYSLLQPYAKQLQIVLLTHQHGDHINTATLRRLTDERPSLRVGCCIWMLPYTEGIRNVDIYIPGRTYDYGTFQIIPVTLYHDTPNCGYRIYKQGKKIFHATDTAHLEGIDAPAYDLYAIEHNYDAEIVFDRIDQAHAEGRFDHRTGSVNSHLSEQQAREFIYKNRAPHSQVLRLHESTSYI